MTKRPRRTTHRRLFTLASIFMAILVAFAACTDDDEDRRFASEPLPPEDRPTLPPTPQAAATWTPATPLPAQASPEALLVASDAPRRIFFMSGNELWTISASGGDAQRIFAPHAQNEIIAAYTASPADETVAVLLVNEGMDQRSPELVLLDADGTQVRQMDLPTSAADSAESGSDDPEALGKTPSIDWSPDGSRLLLTFRSGGLLSIPIHGGEEPTLLIDTAQAAPITGATWSPAGDAVAFLSPTEPTGDVNLYVAPAGSPPLDPVAIAPPQGTEGRSVTGMAWVPDGSGILFTEDATAGDDTMGGDLFRASPGGGDRVLVASAGRAAPVADVLNFAPSPDGRAVAYTVFLPGSSGPAFHSLWIQPIGSAESLRLPVPAGQVVTDLWWTDEGLIWRALVSPSPGATSYDGTAFSLYRADSAGEPVVIYERDLIPEATPEASPAAPPMASPATSAVGTPASSPVSEPD